ncbi:MAG TPA: ABC transporter permease subunit, partial [Chloroflexia bacterium]|nr:ABC transporter permease subunit [Chloroflexia bacterium]
LDSLTRAALQEWLLDVWRRLGATIILVTHDVDEAVLLSDTVYVLTPRPARIAAVEAITLPHPRTLESLAAPAFLQHKARLLAALRTSGALQAAGGSQQAAGGSEAATGSWQLAGARQPTAVTPEETAAGSPDPAAGRVEAVARQLHGEATAGPARGLIAPQPTLWARLRGSAIWPAAGALVIILALWEAYVDLAGVSRRLLPAPSAVGQVLLLDAGVLWDNMVITLGETVLGFVAAMVVGLGFAVLIDRSTLLRRALYPLLVASQTVPSIAYAPLLVIWFGYDILPKVLVVLVYCFFPVVVAALDGFRATDPELVRLFRTFGASGRQIFRQVRFPNALPAIFSGVRIAITYSVTGAVVGEYVGATAGLGIYIQKVKNSFQVDRVFAAIVVIALLSVGLFAAVSLVERLALPWYHATRDSHKEMSDS